MQSGRRAARARARPAASSGQSGCWPGCLRRRGHGPRPKQHGSYSSGATGLPASTQGRRKGGGMGRRDGMWGVEWRMLIPREIWTMPGGGPGQSGLSPEQGAPGHPQAQQLRAPAGPRAAAHPAPCPVPEGQDHSQAHSGFGDFSAGTAARHRPQQVPRPAAKPSQGGRGWPSHCVPTGTHLWQRSHAAPPTTPSLQPTLVNH